ncbi:MAG TPA: MFS transporter [Burkholderiales bacterium]|nr:MFS transporter [Burkholderiales bacterium]
MSDFRLFLAGRFFAALALQMQSVAIGWYLYDRTGNAMALAYAGLAVFVPIALFSLPGGDVADRVDRRWILGTAHLAQATGSAVLVLLTFIKTEETWPFYAVLALAGTARAFSGPAVQSLLPFLVPRERFPQAVAWSSSAQQTATVLGPAVGGLIYLAGASASFAACSVASLAVASCWFSIRARGGVAHAPGGSAVARLFEGLRYLRVNRVLLGAISLDLFAVLLGSITALLPIYARDILGAGPDGLGLMRSAVAVGAVTMGLALAQLPGARQAHAGAMLFTGVAVFGVAALAFGISKNFVLSLALLAIMGAADMMSVFVRASVVQLGTPDEMRGRVSAVHSLFVGTANELGDFRAGSMAAWLGALPAVLAGGCATLTVVAVWAWLFPELRRVARLTGIRT